MRKPLSFYVISERTDHVKYCKRKGLIPYKFIDKSLDGQILNYVTQYVYKGYIYNALGYDQCYSGYMLTLMRLPQLSYEELLNTALRSRKYAERAGATGMILKDYPKEFEKFLLSIKLNNNLLE